MAGAKYQHQPRNVRNQPCPDLQIHKINISAILTTLSISPFANQLKTEISCIAKKEVRTEVQYLKKASPRYRS